MSQILRVKNVASDHKAGECLAGSVVEVVRIKQEHGGNAGAAWCLQTQCLSAPGVPPRPPHVPPQLAVLSSPFTGKLLLGASGLSLCVLPQGLSPRSLGCVLLRPVPQLLALMSTSSCQTQHPEDKGQSPRFVLLLSPREGGS